MDFNERINMAVNKAIQLLLDDFSLREGGKNLKVTIYPFGRIGQLTKRILNDVYGMKEDYIFDKQISKYNPEVKNLDDYDKEDLKDAAVIIASDELSIYDEIRKKCMEKFSPENIFDIFTKVCVTRDVRVETLRLNAERIKELGIGGNVAEVGVYKGDFAREINRYFDDRILYLFDTFEGFYIEKLRGQMDRKWMAYLETAVDYRVNEENRILDNFKNPEKCVIKKGFFPDTTIGLEETFCFVSLDVDIYTSTKAGLEYFWPRMEKNGIIMVHDYNCNNTKGVKKAIDEFAEKNHVPVVMVADRSGSAILTKF